MMPSFIARAMAAVGIPVNADSVTAVANALRNLPSGVDPTTAARALAYGHDVPLGAFQNVTPAGKHYQRVYISHDDLMPHVTSTRYDHGATDPSSHFDAPMPLHTLGAQLAHLQATSEPLGTQPTMPPPAWMRATADTPAPAWLGGIAQHPGLPTP